MARPVTAFVDGRAVDVAPGETLLQAALRQGVEFPHRCRVGACATCRCRLVEGRVRSLTESCYVLEDDELDRGVILACQGVNLTRHSHHHAQGEAPFHELRPLPDRTHATADERRLAAEGAEA